MADDEAPAATEPPEKVVKALSELLDALAPDPAPVVTSAPKRPIDELYGAVSSADISASTQSAAGAIGRYRNAMRWMVAAVAAIGVVLFGSTVFTDGNALADVEGRIGLALASVGLTAILYAATLVFEPVDASLGELRDKFARARRSGGLRGPRQKAVVELRQRLTGSEAPAHLGPGRNSVTELIEGIQANEAARAEGALVVARRRRELEQRTADRGVVAEHLAALLEARGDGSASDPTVDRRLGAAGYDLREAIRLERVARDRLVAAQNQLEEYDHQLGMDILHRSLVLDEAAVAELRGTFRLSRGVLLVGAIATLIGAVVYLNALNAEDDPAPPTVQAGTLTVDSDTPAAGDFTTRCLDTELQVLVPQEEFPALADEFLVVVSDPEECAGTYTIPGGRGDDDITLDLNRPVKVAAGDAEGSE